MASIKDNLKKLVTAVNKETVVDPEQIDRMKKIAEAARKEAKTQNKQ